MIHLKASWRDTVTRVDTLVTELSVNCLLLAIFTRDQKSQASFKLIWNLSRSSLISSFGSECMFQTDVILSHRCLWSVSIINVNSTTAALISFHMYQVSVALSSVNSFYRLSTSALLASSVILHKVISDVSANDL